MNKDIYTTAILGAGTMGVSLAKLISSKGINVILVDRNINVLQASKVQIQDAAKGVVFTEELNVEHQPNFIIECVTEDSEIKSNAIMQAELVVPDSTIILTNTSGIPIDEISKNMRLPERFLGAHFFNPAHVIPVVEVVPGTLTNSISLETAVHFLSYLGKRPVVLNTYIPGFIANRIQHAIMRECLSLLEKGIVEAKELDEIVKYSIGIRMALNGPFIQRDLNGLDTHLNIARYLYPELESCNRPAKTLEDLVAAGHIGAKSGQGFYHWDDKSYSTYLQEEKKKLERIIKISLNSQHKE